jgi:hypothetical protein
MDPDSEGPKTYGSGFATLPTAICSCWNRGAALQELQGLLLLRHGGLTATSFLLAAAGPAFQPEIHCPDWPAFRPGQITARLLQAELGTVTAHSLPTVLSHVPVTCYAAVLWNRNQNRNHRNRNFLTSGAGTVTLSSNLLLLIVNFYNPVALLNHAALL